MHDGLPEWVNFIIIAALISALLIGYALGYGFAGRLP